MIPKTAFLQAPLRHIWMVPLIRDDRHASEAPRDPPPTCATV